MIFEDEIRALTKQLYPKGRAFKMPNNGTLDRVNMALAITESKAFEDGRAILSSILPDNPDFDTQDATLWEIRLGLIVNPTVSLVDRKAAIVRKMNHPSDIKARQHWRYIERSLRLANFDVYVHENLAGVTPQDYILAGGTVGQYGDFEYGQVEYGDASQDIVSNAQYGQLEYGQGEYGGISYTNVVANHINANLDATFNYGTNFRNAFFIGGQTYGGFANVDANREAEFRQLILKLKPTNTVAFIFINYV